MMTSSMRHKTTITIGIIAAVALVLGVLFFGFSPAGEVGEQDRGEEFAASAEHSETLPRSAPDGWRKYENAPYSFSLFYPEGMTARQFDEGGGAQTVIFEDAVAGQGFQIFIVPYDGAQVSEERFLKDVPSGVRRELTVADIGGVSASAFYSTDALLGETREVWFTRNGYLFEVTAPAVLDTWLAQILDTWQFN